MSRRPTLAAGARVTVKFTDVAPAPARIVRAARPGESLPGFVWLVRYDAPLFGNREEFVPASVLRGAR